MNYHAGRIHRRTFARAAVTTAASPVDESQMSMSERLIVRLKESIRLLEISNNDVLSAQILNIYLTDLPPNMLREPKIEELISRLVDLSASRQEDPLLQIEP